MSETGALKTLRVTKTLSADRRHAALQFSQDIPDITWSIVDDGDTTDGLAFGDASDNFALLAALPIAMHRGWDLHIAGSVCPELLSNAEELVQYRHMWNGTPLINVSADTAHWSGGYDPSSPHIMALSGGVDSTYAFGMNAQRYGGQAPSPRGRNVTTAMMIRGFDFPQGPSEGFLLMARKIKNIASKHGANTVFVDTNWKSVACGHGAKWEQQHILALSAIMHLFDGPFGGGLVAADFSYRSDQKMLAWGSNSIVNSKLSAGSFAVQPRGTEASRIEKVKKIAEFGTIEDINVCFAGPRTGENCGKCTKCRRTMLMMAAMGLDPTACFPNKATWKDALMVPVDTNTESAHLIEMLKHWDDTRAPEMRRAIKFKLALRPIERHLVPHLRKFRYNWRQRRSLPSAAPCQTTRPQEL